VRAGPRVSDSVLNRAPEGGRIDVGEAEEAGLDGLEMAQQGFAFDETAIDHRRHIEQVGA
jgi:hypothetical protein